MKFIVVDPVEVEALNRDSAHVLSPVQIEDGRWVLNFGLFMDPVIWGWAHAYLYSCEIVELTRNDFPHELPTSLH